MGPKSLLGLEKIVRERGREKRGQVEGFQRVCDWHTEQLYGIGYTEKFQEGSIEVRKCRERQYYPPPGDPTPGPREPSVTASQCLKGLYAGEQSGQ